MRILLAGTLCLLSACQIVPNTTLPNPSLLRQLRTLAPALKADFVLSNQIPQTDFQAYTAKAQAYADEISKKREIDFFKLHTNPIALQLELNQSKAWLLTYLGTALDRNDLNVELRLLASQNPQMHLNYSGPVTLGRQNFPFEKTLQTNKSTDFNFELLQGLPGNGIEDSYGEHLMGLARYLPYRYQARPIEFDDAPLIYAIKVQDQLQGFVFYNQRNRLILGERKYADVQSVAVISPQAKLLAAYTSIGFNIKTQQAQINPVYQIEQHPQLGPMVQFGEYP